MTAPKISVAVQPGASIGRRDFVLGTATSAYQIEGAVAEDGRVPSIWDVFCQRQGVIADGSDGSSACGHYKFWEDDVKLLARIGFDAYRFSIAWPRCIRQAGRPNRSGSDFYLRLCERLLSFGIRPMVTLYHWDLPQWVQDRGGWLVADSAKLFADYADHMSRVLGDLVSMWATLNEPWCAAHLGHATGEHAPGLCDRASAHLAARNLMLAHARASEALRANLPAAAQVGIVLNPVIAEPADPQSAADREAAQLCMQERNDVYLNALFGMDPPVEFYSRHPGLLPAGAAAQPQAAASCRPDFLGVNWYTRSVVKADGSGFWTEVPPDKDKATDLGWEICPDSLRDTLLMLGRRWPVPPLWITENGAAFDDRPGGAGLLADEARQRYIRDHLLAVEEACALGADVRGYFVWTLMDNFEWAYGYTKRFGIIRVDFATFRRSLRGSALMLAKFQEQRGQGA